jgi:hypothetical protein
LAVGTEKHELQKQEDEILQESSESYRHGRPCMGSLLVELQAAQGMLMFLLFGHFLVIGASLFSREITMLVF